jgi:hypothetical protein
VFPVRHGLNLHKLHSAHRVYLCVPYDFFIFFYYWLGGTESLGIFFQVPRYLLVPGTAATLAYCTNVPYDSHNKQRLFS